MLAETDTAAIAETSPPPAGAFEKLPKWLNLVPMVAQWVWLGIRHGSVTLPSCANPGITSGGLVGEGKLEYFAGMGPIARAATAQHIGVCNHANQSVAAVLPMLADAGLGFPMVAKPDLGWCGYGVRRLESTDDLANYLQEFPRDETFLLQRLLLEPGEAGLFYMRDPSAASGELIGVLLRALPAVHGNGRDSIARLVAEDTRLARAAAAGAHAFRIDRERVPAAGERVVLSTVASTRAGGAYLDGTALVTPALVAAVEAVARDMGADFTVGRFDVRYADRAALQRGEFTIMEVNGAGSEAVHAWDPQYRIRDVYRIVFAKQRRLFRIGAEQRRRGHRPIGIAALARLYWRQQRLIGRYPASN